MRLKATLSDEIEKLIAEGFTDFLSDMAEGVDTWAAEIVVSLREKNPVLRLHCILPCKSQADKWSPSARERYLHILKEADSIVYVDREFSRTCLMEGNSFLVDHAELLLAVYNGEQRGGTAATVRYARKKNLHVILLSTKVP